VSGNFSLADLVAIRWLVRTTTWEPILSIQEQPDGTASITTGPRKRRGLLDGHGRWFTLTRRNGWKIIRSGIWVATREIDEWMGEAAVAALAPEAALLHRRSLGWCLSLFPSSPSAA
jgi:hypothetical protein